MQDKLEDMFMLEAIRQAKKAAANGDVPIGCVIVRMGKLYPVDIIKEI